MINKKIIILFKILDCTVKLGKLFTFGFMQTTKGILLFLIFSMYCSCSFNKKVVMNKKSTVEFQGHRGCRGLMPENTIPAFIKALEYVQILELDVVVSKDNKIIVSHDPWMEASICSHPDGRVVTEMEEKELRLLDMNYIDIKTFDCGKRGNKKFPSQQKLPAYKPSLIDMVAAVDKHCQDHDIPLPYYDIEIKSQQKWYDKYTPQPEAYVKLILAELHMLGIEHRCNLQSFDINILEEVHKQDPKIIQAYLIENLHSFDKNMNALSFTPDIYSPYYKFVTQNLADKVHQRGMKLIPWTVNEIKDMKKMIENGVDGIITDYPDRVELIR
jgi:glycerophosphoryl diester phosphodiesterase